jgi:anti-anti-sigma factor
MKRDFTFSQELRIHQQSLPSGWVLTPQGPIDSNTTEQFTNRVREYFEEKKPAPDLLLDLSGVRYLSSVGLGALIQLLKKSQENQTAFALYDPQLAVRRVLEISKLDFLVVDPAAAAASGPFAEYITQKEAQRPTPLSGPAPS